MKSTGNNSMEDCTIETITPAKKKKMKQAQLPFQTLSSPKLPTDISSKKRKRKTMSPLIGSKSPKVVKLTTKENSVRRTLKKEEEESDNIKFNSNDIIDIISSDDERKDLEQDDQRMDRKYDSTPKKKILGKNKKLDRSQQKPGALTKFLRKADKEVEENDISHDNLSELKNKKDYQDTSVCKDKNEICANESSSTGLIQSEQHLDKAQSNSNIDDPINKGTDVSVQESHCDITNLSSDSETLSELDKSTLNENKEATEPTTPVTPKSNKDMKNKIKKLTPKQVEKKEAIAKRKEEKLKLKMEKKKKREEEKANRRREREEKQREKEEKERIEKEQKKKEKELKELKKQMEIEQKQKEKEAREEERKKREEAKEEEKKRKEEERLEAERKKQKAASNFASFFVPKKQEIKLVEEENIVEVRNFMPFEIKADMRIAPIYRRVLSEHEKLLLDEKCNLDLDKNELYLEDIKKGRIVPRFSSKTWPLETKDDDIILLDDDNDGSSNIITDTHNLEKHRPKLLQFNENRRPPYWGTWQKRSNVLNSRRPFVKDEKWFDYEVDSDDEWEEEEPGESLKGSDDEKDEENTEENEYDVDNEFMVPHGYLSDEEARADEEEMEDMSPQTQKIKLKILGEQFEAERNAKTYKLKPKIIGCIWQGPDNLFPESIPAKIKEFLSARQAWVSNIPIIFPSTELPEEDISADVQCKTPSQQSMRGSKKTKFPDEAVPDLIRLVHGNRDGRLTLMREFITFWNRNDGSYLSKVSVLSKINEIANKIACPEEGPMHLKSCWYVPEHIRKQYFPDTNLSLPNSWKYLRSNRKGDTENIPADKKEEKEEKEKKHVPLITQFTKKITQEEMKKQLTKSDQEETKNQSTTRSDQEETKEQVTAKFNQKETKKQLKVDQTPVISKLPPLQRPPKRATLISVGRGEHFSEKSRQNMLATFIGINKKKEESSSNKTTVNSGEVMFIENIDTRKTDEKLESNNKT